MKTTINETQFRDAVYALNYSYKAVGAIYEFLTDYEKNTGEEIELDVPTINMAFTEYAKFEEAKKDYPDINTLEDLQDRTTVLMLEGGGLVIWNY